MAIFPATGRADEGVRTSKDGATTSAAAAQAEVEKKIAAEAAAMRDRLVAQRRDFHVHPELSNREERTARVVAERLRQIGFTDVRTGIAHYGVAAVLRGGKPGPVIAVRADMDALPIQEINDVPYKSQTPGVKHACGHDVHTTVELGVAEILFGLRAQLPGTVLFIFQPAEEGPPSGEEGGAPLMLKEGVLKDPKPEAIFGLHTDPTIEAGEFRYTSGPMLASSDTWAVTIHGKESHGANPQNGTDAIVVAAQAVEALQTIVSRRLSALHPAVLTIGTIHGGNRFNVVAAEVKMEGTLRTLDEETHQKVPVMMREILDGVTKANGATYELSFQTPGNYVTYNDPKLVAETLAVMRRVAGEKKLVESGPNMVSEDFSWFQQQAPGFYYNLGVGNKARGIIAGWHTAAFDVDEDSLVYGTQMMASVLYDYLERHAGK